MPRVVVLSIIDCIFVFVALIWREVVWPGAALAALLAGISTTVGLLLERRYPSKVTSRYAWIIFVLSGVLGLLLAVLMLFTQMHAVIVVLEITVSMKMIGCGLHFRDEQAG